MTKSERLLEAVGMIDEKHVPEPEKVLKIKSDDNIQEYHAKMTVVNPAEKKKRPLKWAALGTCAAVAAGAILLNNAFLTDRESIDRIFNRPEWETNTERLVNIPAEPFVEGWYGSAAEDIVPIENSNIWTEDISLERMPVFLNKCYDENHPIGGVSSIKEEEMQHMAEKAAEKIGITIYDSYFEYYNDDKTLFDFYANCNGEKYGLEQMRITVTRAGNIYISTNTTEGETKEGFPMAKGYTLPEGYYGTDKHYPDDLEQQEKTIMYLAEQFKELIGYSEPQIHLNVHPNSDPDKHWFQMWLQDKGRDTVENILNYNFMYTSFEFNVNSVSSDFIVYSDQLIDICLSDMLSTQCEYVGDYPLITLQQAMEQLLSGKYSEYFAEYNITESSIVKAEGVYNTGYSDKYFQPYYCFYAALPYEEGIKEYKRFYIPAIDPDGYEAIEETESSHRIFNRPEWQTNTENLITIPSTLPFWERGNSFSAADISLFQNSNPWTEDIYFDSMPVFLNKSYGSSVTGGTNCISNEEMRRMAGTAAEILGLTIDTADFDYYDNDGSMPPASLKAYCDGAKYGTEQVRIMVTSTGDLNVRFDRKDYIDAIADEGQIHECYQLPEGYYNTEGIYPDDLEQQEKTERYLTEQFNELIGYSDPQMMLYTQPYPRDADPRQWLNIWFMDKGRDIKEDVLNYNFASVNFYFNDKKSNQLFGIEIRDRLSTQCEYVGNYPLITAEQAKEQLLSGKYSEYLSDFNITDDSIKRVEGVYNVGYDDQYLQPYYCFYIEIASENGVNQYKRLYSPAIDPDGYEAIDGKKTSDPVFPENIWYTKTWELPYLDVSDDLDFSGYFAHDISEIGNQNNPWNESLELKTLPVFLNTACGTKTAEGYLSPSVLTKEEMIQTAERAADKLGLTIEKTITDYAVNSDQVIDTLTAVCNGESYGVEQISIKVYSSGDKVRVHFGEAMELWDYYDSELQCYKLPEGYELPNSIDMGIGSVITLDEDKKALTMLAEEFKGLTGQDNPTLNVSTTPHYSGNTLTEYKIWDEDEDIVRNILNYNLTQVNFYSNGYSTGELGCIEMTDTLSGAQYLGDYPIISVREAKEELLSQNAIVPPGSYKYGIPVINEELIEKVELVYGNGRGQKYLMPYYRFFVRSERESEGLEGYYEYSQYYVSAVWNMYLNDSETGIYKETRRYGYNTNNLPQITSRFTFHGSGSEGFNALYLRNEEQVAKPEIWQRNFELTEAPVFINLAFYEDHPYSDRYYLDAAEMERMAKAAVNLLGGSIKESHFDYCVSDESLPETLTVRADIPYAEVNVTVTVKSDGAVCINCFDTDEYGVPMGGITLPSGIDITLPEGIREAAEYFKGKFSELIQYAEADIGLEYAGNGQYGVYIHQHSENVERNMVNYYLNNIALELNETIYGKAVSSVTFEVSDPDCESVISSVTFNNRLCAAEYLGHYPLVSYEEAVELLTQGDYRSYVSKSKLKGGVISESDILYGELVYNNGTEDEYFQPYYRFYVELNETADWFEHGDDERVYGEFWVPAVVEEYRGSEKFLGADEAFLRDIYGEAER